MGWSSWNKFGCKISENLIRETIDAIESTGLLKVGYEYINIDDCWQSSRDKNGSIIPDPKTFPHGIKPLVDYAHSKGLKFGIYSDAGTLTCEHRPGSLGFEEIDAKTYAEWGVDYLKYDNCHNNNIKSQIRYEKMRDALKKSGRNIFYSICNWGLDNVVKWGKKVGNSWRTTKDIKDNWKSMIRIIDINNKWYNYSGPGGWNDPGMLEVGNGGMNLEEYKTHFGLWAISKAPLIIGCDVTNMTKEIKNILMNREVIAINQDSLGEQGRKIKYKKIDLPENYNLYPEFLDISTCNGKKEQKWYINENGAIKNNNEDLCIEIPNCSQKIVPLETNRCHIGDIKKCGKSKNQEWVYDTKNKKIYSKLFPNKCFHLINEDKTYISVKTCEKTPFQNFEYNKEEHTFKINGKCLTINMNEEATEVWAGKLSDDSYAVLLLNRGSLKSDVSINWEEIGFSSFKALLRDLWKRKDLGIFEYKYTVNLEPHYSQLLKVTPLLEDFDELQTINKINLIIILVVILLFILIIIYIIIFLYIAKKEKKNLNAFIDEETKKLEIKKNMN